MSKSLGNNVAPQDVIKQSGAEILRLWVSMVDYREDIRLGKEILARTVEAYRKIRNVIRVLVANLYDFDPATDLVPRAAMLEIDRYAMARYAEAAGRIVTAYEDFDYPAIFQAANQFITVDVSAFYVDVTKDRMYTLGARSPERRSGQTAMYHIVDGLARLLAPVLPVTMDELWRNLPGEREVSVHTALFPRDLGPWLAPDLVERWSAIGGVRDQVNVALEQQRRDKVITGSLSAQVTVTAGGGLLALLRAYQTELPTIFGVSQVTLAEGPAGDAVGVEVAKADGTRCDRCWRYVPSVSDDPRVAGLCERCVDALAEPVNG
ncbi:MAG: class I tRNA ligase family protein, partial [Vicinamibacterales bacterium]